MEACFNIDLFREVTPPGNLLSIQSLEELSAVHCQNSEVTNREIIATTNYQAINKQSGKKITVVEASKLQYVICDMPQYGLMYSYSVSPVSSTVALSWSESTEGVVVT